MNSIASSSSTTHTWTLPRPYMNSKKRPSCDDVGYAQKRLRLVSSASYLTVPGMTPCDVSPYAKMPRCVSEEPMQYHSIMPLQASHASTRRENIRPLPRRKPTAPAPLRACKIQNKESLRSDTLDSQTAVLGENVGYYQSQSHPITVKLNIKDNIRSDTLDSQFAVLGEPVDEYQSSFELAPLPAIQVDTPESTQALLDTLVHTRKDLIYEMSDTVLSDMLARLGLSSSSSAASSSLSSPSASSSACPSLSSSLSSSSDSSDSSNYYNTDHANMVQKVLAVIEDEAHLRMQRGLVKSHQRPKHRRKEWMMMDSEEGTVN